MDWASFAIGGLAVPCGVAVVFIIFATAWDAIRGALQQRQLRKHYAVFCDRCYYERGKHGSPDERCPRPQRYEDDPSQCFKAKGEAMAERKRARGAA